MRLSLLGSSFIRSRLEFTRRLPNTSFSGSINKFATLTSEKDPNSEGMDKSKQHNSFLGDVFVQNDLKKGMMSITILYKTVDRMKQLNLFRKSDEPLSQSLERLKLNLSRVNKRDKKLKTEASIPLEISHSVELKVNGVKLDPTSITNLDAWIDGAVLELNGDSYLVRANCPGVESMHLSSSIMKNFVTIPFVTLRNCRFDMCEFTWYRKILSNERSKLAELEDYSEEKLKFDDGNYWYKVSSEPFYCPVDDDVGHFLKVTCSPSDGERTNLEYSCVSVNPVEVGPLYCPFEKRHQYTKEKSSSLEDLRVVTYNILADLYADSHYSRSVLFGYCPSHALDLDYRRQLLLKELIGYNADLICLQEVDKKEFVRTYERFFKLTSKCSGIYNTKGGSVAEGVATFYRTDKFELLDSHATLISDLVATREEKIALSNPKDDNESGECPNLDTSSDYANHPILRDPTEAKRCLSNFIDIRSALSSNEKLKRRLLARHTIIQTSLLELKFLPNYYIIVANTHLYFAPDADHIRLLQGSVCAKYLEYLRNFYREMLISNQRSLRPVITIVFCGDMNSSPDCGLFRLLHEGKVPSNLADWSSNEQEAVVGLEVETSLRLKSAYQDIEYTNYTHEFKGCLDYIYYESDYLHCESTVPLPDHEEVSAIGGIPSDVFPSDHLALIANLKLAGQCQSDNKS